MHTLHNTIKDQQKIAYAFWALVLLIICCAILYVFMINKTVLNIVASQKMGTEAGKLSSDISRLETQNIALNGRITPEFAATLGFVQPANPEYISYKQDGSLSINAQ
jgi:cell division protein FtsL